MKIRSSNVIPNSTYLQDEATTKAEAVKEQVGEFLDIVPIVYIRNEEHRTIELQKRDKGLDDVRIQDIISAHRITEIIYYNHACSHRHNTSWNLNMRVVSYHVSNLLRHWSDTLHILIYFLFDTVASFTETTYHVGGEPFS